MSLALVKYEPGFVAKTSVTLRRKIYVIGSLRNPEIPKVAQALRNCGWNAFDDWHSCGPEADDNWQRYETDRGRDLRGALTGLSANHNFYYDKHHMDSSDVGILVLPAGKSGHLELGYMIGQGKPGYILCPSPPERFDVMYKFAAAIFYSVDEMVEFLGNPGSA